MIASSTDLVSIDISEQAKELSKNPSLIVLQYVDSLIRQSLLKSADKLKEFNLLICGL